MKTKRISSQCVGGKPGKKKAYSLIKGPETK